jgi:beta-glucanase (GH16 family)
MLKSRYLFLILALVLAMVMLGVAPAQAAYNLVWSDEFNGSSVDTSKWVFETGNNGGWGNGELEYYQAANATVSGGILTITAKKENVGGCSYTSTRMKTAGKYSFTYGKAEARLLIPKGKGLWPAFWMLGNSINSGTPWPDCGEVDIMEHINTDDNCVGTIHWNSGSGHASYGLSKAVSNIATWHTYSIEWTSAYIRWFVDGVQYCEANILNNINNTGCFHKPFFFLLNLAVGGAWPGNPDGSTPFPSQYQIDYVRVYQDTGGGTTPGPTPTATRTPSGGSSGLVNNAIYRIEPACAPGKCLDVANVGTADNSNVQIWTWSGSGGANQKWKAVDVGGGYWKFIPQHATTKALDVAGAGSTDGTNVVIYADNGTNAQKWKLYDAGGGYFRLEPACAPGKALDVASAANTDGANVQIYTSNGSNAQKWIFYRL